MRPPAQELFELRDLDRVLGVLLFAAVCRGPPGAGAAFIDVLVAKVRRCPAQLTDFRFLEFA